MVLVPCRMLNPRTRLAVWSVAVATDSYPHRAAPDAPQRRARWDLVLAMQMKGSGSRCVRSSLQSGFFPGGWPSGALAKRPQYLSCRVVEVAFATAAALFPGMRAHRPPSAVMWSSTNEHARWRSGAPLSESHARAASLAPLGSRNDRPRAPPKLVLLNGLYPAELPWQPLAAAFFPRPLSHQSTRR